MGFTVDTSLSAAAAFAQGLFSFFSPCVLPLLPLYLGYLSGGVSAHEESAARRRGRTLLNTLFFVIGISFAIFLLGLGMSLIGSFFGGNRLLFARIGGVIVILFGLYQLGVFGGSTLLSGEKRLPLRLDKMAMSPWTALLMGFVFSFAWTPCVGPAIPALDFELTDQYSETHTLEQYRGKVVFLNFWATWCPPCRAEMPDIQSLYEKYGPDHDEAAILAVATPGYNGEGSEAEVKAFLEENGYTYPVLMDDTGEQMRYYGISAIPTTFMIDADGNIYGYVPGAMSMETMQSIIDQTLQGSAR